MNYHKQFLSLLWSLSYLILIIFFLGKYFVKSAQAEPSASGTVDQSSYPERVIPQVNNQSQFVSPNTIFSSSAEDLATAMGVPNSDLLAADLMGSDASSVGINDTALGTWFPTKGNTFTILSTGLAADASLPNDSGSHSTILNGINNSQGEDLVRLHLQLKVPAEINCAAFDFAFYSEEFPEFVGSPFNDAFTAQLNDSSLNIENDQVVAPGNFAYDTEGNLISINTVFNFTEQTGTTYDGVTPLLRASTIVLPGSVADMYLSIQDLGDSVLDSAVFLDNFFWSKDPHCQTGAQSDTDGDGLLDDWEINGLTVTVGDTEEFINLLVMGAEPDHKDIFVEIDWMVSSGLLGHNHQPDPEAIQMIVDAFNNAPVNNPDGTSGIHLHVDYGSDSPMPWGHASTWGGLSHAEQLPHQTNISTCTGSNFNWDGFDAIKQNHLTPGRAAVFHYNIWAHNLCADMAGTSGISRNADGPAFGSGASDFIVSLGNWSGHTGTVNEQAGTFMHELGHNLGLRHGGSDHNNWKPNYLSVMGYSFQTRGLIINNTEGHFDYSRYELPSLDENHLDETSGINLPSSLTDTLGTRFFRGLDDMRLDTDAHRVDWNCDGDENDTDVSRNINQGRSWNNNTTLDTLTSQNDWDNLVFTGGAISQPGADVTLPVSSEVIDIDNVQDAEIPSLSEVIINDNDEYTNEKGVTVSLNYPDNTEKIRLSNSLFREDSIIPRWGKPERQAKWNLTGMFGEVTVYAQFKYDDGTLSEIISDSIFYDGIKPLGKAVINNGASFTNNVNVKVKISPVENGSGLDQMKISNLQGMNDSQWQPYQEESDWQLEELEDDRPQIRQVYVKLKDKAGNVSSRFQGVILLKHKSLLSQ